MRIPSQLRYIFSGIATLAILAGCSGAGTTPGDSTSQQPSDATQSSARQAQAWRFGLAPGMQQRVHSGAPVKGFFSREALAPGGTMGFISDLNNNVVYIVNTQGTVTATLTGFTSPDGMSVDKAGNLYVANNGAANILKLAPPYNGTPTVINDAGEYPVMVAVDSNGDLAVTAIDNTSGGNGDVAFYTAGATNPTSTISQANYHPGFCAFDAAGNLYIDALTANGVALGEVVGGISGTTITPLSTANSLEAIGGVQVTKSGNIAVDDQVAKMIYSYNPPTNGNLGSPVATTPLTGAGDPVNFALGIRNLKVITADNGLGQGEEYAFPAGGSPVLTSTLPAGAGPIGAAINPTAQDALF